MSPGVNSHMDSWAHGKFAPGLMDSWEFAHGLMGSWELAPANIYGLMGS